MRQLTFLTMLCTTFYLSAQREVNYSPPGTIFEKQAISIDVNQADSHYLDNAFYFYQKKDFIEAKNVLEKVNFGDDNYAYYLLGNIEFALKDFEGAKNAFAKSLNLSDKSESTSSLAQIGYERAKVRSSSGEFIRHLNDVKPKDKKSDENSLRYAFDVKKNSLDSYPKLKNRSNKGSVTKSLRELSKIIDKNFKDSFRHNIGSRTGVVGYSDIEVLFAIDENGELNIQKVEAVHPLLEQETIRILNDLPKMQPALKDGKTTSVDYMLTVRQNLGWYKEIDRFSHPDLFVAPRFFGSRNF